MNPFTLKEINTYGNNQDNITGNQETIINKIYFDSRNIVQSTNSLFIDFSDKEDYIKDAYKKGIRNFISNKNLNFQDINLIKVDNPLKFLQQFAQFYLQHSSLTIIGITGSNGKTIVKEWLYQCLWNDKKVVRSPKSYNSQLGLPLSILETTKHDEIGIFEVGISQPKEMAVLETILKPEIGILTNIREAHSANFKDINEHINEKLNLFEDSKVIIYQGDRQEVKDAVISRYADKSLMSFGKKIDNSLRLIAQEKIENYNLLTFKYKEETKTIKFHFFDEASVENIMPVILTLLYFQYSWETIQEKINDLHQIEMRLEIKEGDNNCLIINDVFNSDESSLSIALDLLNQQTKPEKILVLTDIEQSQLSDKKLYEKIANMIKPYGFNKIFLIGHKITKYSKLFNTNEIFNSSEEFLNTLKNNHDFSNAAILLKGARKFKLENISTYLELQSHDTVMEVNLNAIIENINIFKEYITPDTKIMAMVKANSYGTGNYEIANILQHFHVNYLGVAYADEGALLRKKGIYLPIMVMNPEQSSFQTIVNHQLEPEIYSFKVLNKLISVLEAKSFSGQFPIHIKIDTGMHRLGFMENEIEALATLLTKNPQLKVISIFSHLSAADNLEHREWTLEQMRAFKKKYDILATRIGYKPIRHILNSSGISNYFNDFYTLMEKDNLEKNMVRIGIGMYGYSPDKTVQKKLSNVVQLKTVISQIKVIKPNESISYNRHYFVSKPTKIAILPIGYADGIRRMISQKNAYVLINEQQAPIISTICMDMMMVDISDISCSEGDEVIVIGKNPSLEQFANWANTIPYEVLTSIPARVKRIFIRE